MPDPGYRPTPDIAAAMARMRAFDPLKDPNPHTRPRLPYAFDCPPALHQRIIRSPGADDFVPEQISYARRLGAVDASHPDRLFRLTIDQVIRFWEKVRVNNPDDPTFSCWNWQGSVHISSGTPQWSWQCLAPHDPSTDDYNEADVPRKISTIACARMSFHLWQRHPEIKERIGAIWCRNQLCVRPDHLGVRGSINRAKAVDKLGQL